MWLSSGKRGEKRQHHDNSWVCLFQKTQLSRVPALPSMEHKFKRNTVHSLESQCVNTVRQFFSFKIWGEFNSDRWTNGCTLGRSIERRVICLYIFLVFRILSWPYTWLWPSDSYDLFSASASMPKRSEGRGKTKTGGDVKPLTSINH
jgi:hypothetical protein